MEMLLYFIVVAVWTVYLGTVMSSSITNAGMKKVKRDAYLATLVAISYFAYVEYLL